jgi:hypothetical protein
LERIGLSLRDAAPPLGHFAVVAFLCRQACGVLSVLSLLLACQLQREILAARFLGGRGRLRLVRRMESVLRTVSGDAVMRHLRECVDRGRKTDCTTGLRESAMARGIGSESVFSNRHRAER